MHKILGSNHTEYLNYVVINYNPVSWRTSHDVVFFIFFNFIVEPYARSPLLWLDTLAANSCLDSVLYFLESL